MPAPSPEHIRPSTAGAIHAQALTILPTVMFVRIQIISTGEFLFLADNSLTVKIRSSLFQESDSLKGSISYPGVMPLEDNRAKINNAHFIHSDAGLRTFMVRVWLGSMPWKIARFNYTIAAGNINYTLFIDGSIIAKRMQKLKLRDLYIPDKDGLMIFPDGAACQAWLNNTVTAKPGTYPLVLFPYKNDGAYQEVAPDHYADYPNISFPINKYFNDWAITDTGTGRFKWNSNYADSSETQTPFFLLTYVLRRYCEFFGLTPLGTWLDSDFANRLVMHSNVVLPSAERIPDVTYFMPDMLVSDFLTECRSQWGIMIEPDMLSNTCVIESLDALQSAGEVLDLTGCQVLSYEEVSTTLKAFTASQGAADNDTAYSDNEKDALPVLQVGDPDTATDVTDIPLASVATKMITETSNSGAAMWRVPYIKQPVSGNPPFYDISDVKRVDQTQFSLRFLIYHGMQKNSAGFYYPYGSSDNVDLYNQPISKYSLALSTRGITSLALKKYYEFLKNSKPFRMGFNLQPFQFLAMRANTRIKIKDPNNQAAVYCLLDEIEADLNSRDTVLANATLYPILHPVNLFEPTVDESDPVIPEPDPDPVDNGTVYVKLVLRNLTSEYKENPPPGYSALYQDVWLQFFSNAAGTTPKNVTSLQVRLQTVSKATGSQDYTNVYLVDATSVNNEFEAVHRAQVYYKTGPNELRQEYSLAPASTYNIIT